MPRKSRCCMPVCQNERFEFVHRLPSTLERRLQWFDMLNEPSLQQIQYPSICARHFRPDDYVHTNSKSLNRNAIPSLNLKDLSQLGICKQIENYSTSLEDLVNDEECDFLGQLFSPCSRTNVSDSGDQEPEPETELEDKASASKRRKVQSAKSVQQSHETADMVNEKEYLTLNDIERTLLEGDCATIEMLVEQDDDDQEEVVKEECADVNYLSSVDEEVEFEDDEQIKNMPESCSAQDAEESEVACTSTSNESNIQLNSQEIIIQHLDYAETLRLDFLWLRDFCKCDDCYDCKTHSRLCDVTVQKPDLRPDTASLFHDNLVVEWNDNHISKYEISELFSQQLATTSSQISWIARHASFRDDFNALRFDNLICSASTINTAFDRLQRSGVLLISDVSTAAQQKPLMVELLLRRLFPQNYQQLIKEERSDFHHAQQLPHTNCTFLSESCGLQILGLNPVSAAETLELTIVDGLNAAQQLRNSTRQTFDFLTNYKVPLVYRSTEDFDFITEVPMIQLRDGELERLHFAPYQRGNMAKENLHKFCDALRRISRIIMQKQLQWKLCLRKDMIVILDNWRICWQVRKQASDVAANLDSNFKLDCAYVERKHFQSRLHCLQLDK